MMPEVFCEFTVGRIQGGEFKAENSRGWKMIFGRGWPLGGWSATLTLRLRQSCPSTAQYRCHGEDHFQQADLSLRIRPSFFKPDSSGQLPHCRPFTHNPVFSPQCRFL